MTLRTQPYEPSPGMYYTIERRVENAIFESWEKFLPGFRPAQHHELARPLSPN
jgi:hypothetical protein